MERSQQIDPPHGTRLAFPITSSPKEFNKAVDGRKRLGDFRTDTAVRAAIEGLQPYNRLQPPHLPALQLLRELNDQDKHRMIALTRSDTAGGSVQLRIEPPVDTGFTITGLDADPIRDGTRLMEITTEKPVRQVHVESQLRIVPVVYHSTDDKGTDRSGVDWVLENVRNEVEFSLDQITKLLPK